MSYVSQSEMARFERALDLKGFDGGKQVLQEYFALPKMSFWDEKGKLRVS